MDDPHPAAGNTEFLCQKSLQSLVRGVVYRRRTHPHLEAAILNSGDLIPARPWLHPELKHQRVILEVPGGFTQAKSEKWQRHVADRPNNQNEGELQRD